MSEVSEMLARRRKDAEALGGHAEFAIEEIDAIADALQSRIAEMAELHVALALARKFVVIWGDGADLSQIDAALSLQRRPT